MDLDKLIQILEEKKKAGYKNIVVWVKVSRRKYHLIEIQERENEVRLIV